MDSQIIMARLLLEAAPRSKKAEYLESYMSLIVEEGFEAATLTKLAQKHKTSKARIRYYLPNLEEAALEIFKLSTRLGVQFTEELVGEQKTLTKQLQALLKAPFLWAMEYPKFAQFILLAYHRASSSDEIAKVHIMSIERGRERIYKALLNAKYAKNARPYSSWIHSQMIASLILMLSMNDFKKDSIHVKNYENFVRKLLGVPFKVF